MRRLTGYILFIFVGSLILAVCFYQKLGVFKKSTKAFPVLNYCIDSSDYNDYLFIGASRVAYGINPVVIDSMDNIKSYAVAADGSRLMEQNLMLTEYLLNHPKPKTIFLAIDYNGFSVNGGPASITDYFSYMDNPVVYRCLSPYNLAFRFKPAQYYWLILRIFALPDSDRKNKLLKSLFNIEPPTVKGDVFFRGFSPIMTGWGARAENELRTVKSKIFYQKEGFDILKSMVDKCRNDSVNLVFIVPPAFCEVGTKYLNEAEVVNRAREIAIKNNVPFWDYRTLPICKSRSYFYDFLHLNHIGARIYSAQLAKDIKEKLSANGSPLRADTKPK